MTTTAQTTRELAATIIELSAKIADLKARRFARVGPDAPRLDVPSAIMAGKYYPGGVPATQKYFSAR